MTAEQIDALLTAAESRMAGDTPLDLRELGFWRAVDTVKRDADLVEQFADRIGTIDGAAFNAWARLVIPLGIATVLAVLASIIGLGLVVFATAADGWAWLPFLVGTGTLIGATHGLGHLVVGYLGSIRFTAWFVGRNRPQPGVKTDYATYLRATPRARAWMHASGAIVTKTIPFLLLPLALLTPAIGGWVVMLLLVLGVVQIVADIVWSTKSSDWAKYRREMRYANGA